MLFSSASRARMQMASTGLALGLWTGTALANGAARTHDGFFLRMTIGPGYARTAAAFLGTELTFEGDTVAASLAIGGVVASNLTLHGTLFGWFSQNPDLVIGPIAGDYAGDVTLSGTGAGVTYYLMPSNVYVSATLGGGQVEFAQSGGGTTSTDWGFAFDFIVGKEWWVSDNWALGLSGDVGFHNVPDASVSGLNWSGHNFAILFSATFN